MNDQARLRRETTTDNRNVHIVTKSRRECEFRMKKLQLAVPLPILPGNWRRSIDYCGKNSPEIHSHEIFFCHRLPDLGLPLVQLGGTRLVQKAASNRVTSAEVADYPA